jgi:glycerol-3-phosphate dehydrogenase (NAD(P)+)
VISGSPSRSLRCTVVGAGAWGTALANQLAHNGHTVRMWAYESDVVESINSTHINQRFLSDIPLAPSIVASNEMQEVIPDAEVIVMVTPSHVTRAVAEMVQPFISPYALVVVASKGIEQHTLALMTTVVESVLRTGPSVALSGPSFAVEVARQQPTAVVVASEDEHRAQVAQSLFTSPTFRVYTQDDVIGVELGGALKNVMAVATGISEGLGLGLNAQAALITRGLAEMTRLGVALGAQPSTFAGLAGMGDLVLTCTGALSRNRSVGFEIGKGATLDEVLAGRDTVAEGVITTRSAFALAEKHKVSMPIVEATYGVLFENRSPRDAIVDLMTRGLRPERDVDYSQSSSLNAYIPRHNDRAEETA